MTTKDYSRWITSIKRPNWDEYFLSIVDVVKTRSLDANTQVGCVLVNEDNRIIATGYNSFPHGIADEYLPNTRIDGEEDSPKYGFFSHAEQSAIANMVKCGEKNVTCYLSMQPCCSCLKLLYSAGVTRIVLRDMKTWKHAEKEKEYINVLIRLCKISLETLTHKYYPFSGEWSRKDN
jgi:dCMP deaminase